ncbi:MAG: biotin--[acetyl-CoA-carboxylase] ligase [Anaerolineae bacterium]|nr:biotin--[acetyl-CoA-carboxylase] ligase [Anaerolineae bacterium]
MSDLSAETIMAALTTRRLGRPTRFFPRIGSTNDVAHELAAAGAAEGLLVLADEQTAGRGRLDRSWWAPPGASVLMSLLLRPALPTHRAGQLPMCLGLAAVEELEAVTALHPALKWPNDIVWEGRKLGGMLSELRADGERFDYAVLGLGINVNMTFDEPAAGDLAATAVSLRTIVGRPVDRAALVIALLERCEAWYERLLSGESLHEAWAARLDTLGRQVVVALPTGTLTGVAVGVTPEGALIVRRPDGTDETIWAGDVTRLR